MSEALTIGCRTVNMTKIRELIKLYVVSMSLNKVANPVAGLLIIFSYV